MSWTCSPFVHFPSVSRPPRPHTLPGSLKPSTESGVCVCCVVWWGCSRGGVGGKSLRCCWMSGSGGWMGAEARALGRWDKTVARAAGQRGDRPRGVDEPRRAENRGRHATGGGAAVTHTDRGVRPRRGSGARGDAVAAVDDEATRRRRPSCRAGTGVGATVASCQGRGAACRQRKTIEGASTDATPSRYQRQAATHAQRPVKRKEKERGEKRGGRRGRERERARRKRGKEEG